MELHELHVHEGQLLAGHPGIAIASACVSSGGGEVNPTTTAGGHHCVLGQKAMKGAIIQFPGQAAHTFAMGHDQIQDEVVYEVVAVFGVLQGLSIESMDESMARTICACARPLGHTALAVFQGLLT